ncbi:uncharacterized protein LOC124648715 [Lolium rigidum]|uniref:uncharacterized protein LOC124648715 n=1 Tax=Lolium rigidum TaxID=89674 RepID=UPI001F5C16B6|nr:uncharacterized protein LOC124648715 [Lolium rigidum]
MPRQHVRELWQMDEIVEEILFRLPPDEPGNLLRASLVCKPWCRLLSDHGFRRRYSEFHQAPPMLGFLQSWSTSAEFVPTTEFCPREPDPRHSYSVCDCRHGRVLLRFRDDDKQFLTVWNPMTGSQRVLRVPEYSGMSDWCTSVLCSGSSYNHGDCHLGPFLVVFVSLHEQEGVAKACVYSSEMSNWSSSASLDVGFFEDEIHFTAMPSVLAGDALYFLISRDSNIGILEYDLGKSRLSEIHLVPASTSAIICPIAPILMVAEDGQLGLADLYDFNLSVWWREVGPDEVAVWSQCRVIDLETLLPIGDPEVATDLVGSIEGTGIIFAITDLGTYMIDLKALTSKELSTKLYQREDIAWALFPYLSFYSPQGVVAGASIETGHGNEET